MDAMSSTLDEAIRRHDAGDYVSAEHLVRNLVHTDPLSAEGWYLLASSCQALGQLAEAERGFQRVVSLRPDVPEGHGRLGIVYAVQERWNDALPCFLEAARLDPGSPDALNNLANVQRRVGQRERALANYREAIRRDPVYAEAHDNLASLLRDLGRFVEAVASAREAIRLKPDFARAHCNLGVALGSLGRHEEALESFHVALHLDPGLAEALSNLGTTLTELRRPGEALSPLGEALRLDPSNVSTHTNLAAAHRELGALDEALAAGREALRRAPGDARVHDELGLIAWELGRHDEALECFDQALALDPGNPHVARNRAMVLLLLGDYQRGLPAFEARWAEALLRRASFRQPLWDGTPFRGRTLLVHAEQGLGDTLQFVRYLPMVKERGGRVIFACPEALSGLLAEIQGADVVVSLRREGVDWPQFDVHAPLLSLPRIFGTNLDTIPARVPYLHANRGRAEFWATELGNDGRLKVGIAWQGNRAYGRDHLRSVPLERFAPLAEVPGIRLFSLQNGPGREQIGAEALGWPLADLGERLDLATAQFVDTAAVMTVLDLVIAIDSASAHLAGALGVPVWITTSFVPDWRWHLEREDSPWYPTARLFRQPSRGDWTSVFERIARELRQLSEARG
jgi:tetratricopeptide (TPR) repeat protein